MKKTLLTAALAGITAAALSLPVHAAHEEASAKEKCYGVAKAGKNDCHSADGANMCAGMASKDNDPNNWQYVAEGECKKMGGKLAAPKAEAPKSM